MKEERTTIINKIIAFVGHFFLFIWWLLKKPFLFFVFFFVPLLLSFCFGLLGCLLFRCNSLFRALCLFLCSSLCCRFLCCGFLLGWRLSLLSWSLLFLCGFLSGFLFRCSLLRRASLLFGLFSDYPLCWFLLWRSRCFSNFEGSRCTSSFSVYQLAGLHAALQSYLQMRRWISGDSVICFDVFLNGLPRRTTSLLHRSYGSDDHVNVRWMRCSRTTSWSLCPWIFRLLHFAAGTFRP